ncbi:MAG TPA: heme biosynthesis HemY N-terminal domain-containing protein [Burkholderiaceae bacterium]|nr:heme biosynthesis HemY N-terminal domain-containing protein [Burkholderiaceae bacterium]
MRALFWITVLFALGVGLALLARFNAGNVALLVPPYRIDIALNLFLLGIVALFAVTYAVIRIAAHTLGFPDRVRAYRARVREEGARSALRTALTAYFEGRFARAERAANDAQAVQGYQGIAALIAARASHKMREFTRRDEWLRRAEHDNTVRTARLMTEAELLLEERRADEAETLIAQLHASGARHVASLRLALNAAQQLEQWEEVLRLVRQLAKRDAIHPALAARTKALAYQSLAARRRGEPSGLRSIWASMPAEDRTAPEIAEPFARAFAVIGEHRQALNVLEASLERRWDARLLNAYGEIGEAADRVAQIDRAERWLDRHPRDPALLTTLGRLCADEGLWGKAADYLERSLRIERTPHALLVLARVLGNSGDEARADELYRECAELAVEPPQYIPATRGSV